MDDWLLTDLAPARDRGHGTGHRSAPWQWGAALAWCLVLGWFAFVRRERVPLLWCADFGFHELGHLIMYVLPINEVLTAAMGSGLQIAVPLGLAATFWFVRSEAVAAIVCAAWGATSMQDVSVYIADAPYERLPLVGGEHDWAFILGPEHFDRLRDAAAIATVVRTAGALVLLAAIATCCWALCERISTRA